MNLKEEIKTEAGKIIQKLFLMLPSNTDVGEMPCRSANRMIDVSYICVLVYCTWSAHVRIFVHIYSAILHKKGVAR